MAYTQDNRKLSVSTPLGKDELLFRGMSGHEEISRLFRFEVLAIAENKKKIAFDALLGKKVTVKMKMGEDETPTYLNGLCSGVSQGGRDEFFTTYRLVLVPELWLLTRKSQSRIFQQITVPDILRKLFKGLSVSYELSGKYEPRDYCVQYRETDFNFASRLMEEEGIFYFFKHSDGNHEMVVADAPSSHVDVPGKKSLIYEELAGGTRPDERIYLWEKSQEMRSGKVTLWDHSFELPHKHLEAEEPIVASVEVGTISHKLKVGGNDALELYDWPGEYAQRFDGIDPGGGERPADIQKVFQDNKRTTKIRMDEETTPSIAIHVGTNAKHLRSGHKFSLERHFNANGAYVVVESGIDAEQTGDYRSGVSDLRFSCSATCIPSGLKFRPARTTPKPVIASTQSAVVVGPSGEEIFTDKYGRVKVQFHWDREGKSDSSSSCWIRVAHVWSGNKWGGIHIPRIGMEVLVAFLEGDPDQPVIVGTMYNAREMPPYDLPARKTESGIKSRSTLKGGTEDFNELRFEDKKGKELVYFHAQKDFTRIVEHDDDLEVGNDQTILIKRDRKEQVDRNEEVLIRKNRDHHVEGDDGLWVDGSKGRAIRIKKGKHILTIDMGDNIIEIKMGDMKTTLDMGSVETTAKMGNITTKASLGKIEDTALQSIELKVGQSSLKVDQMGVTVKGMMVKLDGQVMTEVKGLITKVEGSAMLKLGGGITMIG